MTAPPSLVDRTGRPVPLDHLLGSGGEGAVYAVANDSTQAVKVYSPAPGADRVEKLAALIALKNPKLLAVAAWPTGTVHDARSRRVVGFVMPRLADCQPVQHLYNPVQRLKQFPRAGWAFQVRAAQNLAAAFDEVHKAGCLVGDVNQSNELVTPQALARLIDCDSFQVRTNGKSYLCEVGTPLYVPPELIGKSLSGIERTTNHDSFGLAVLIFQLLFAGRHPYAGVYHGAGDPTFDQMIAEYRFAHGPQARSWGMSPPPHTPILSDIPPDLGGLFRRAFERGSEVGKRPRPAEWVAALKLLEPSIVECGIDPGHFYWRGAGACVWCRLAAKGGPEYYFGVAGGAGTFAVDEAKLRDVLARLEAIRLIDFPYQRSHYRPPHPPAGRLVPQEVSDGFTRCDLLRAERDKVKNEFRVRTGRERRLRAQREQQLQVEFEESQTRLEERVGTALAEVYHRLDVECKGRSIVGSVLLVLASVGCLLAACAGQILALQVIGLLMAPVFGVWFAVYIYTSPVMVLKRQVAEVRARKRRTLSDLRQKLMAAKAAEARKEARADAGRRAAIEEADRKVQDAEQAARRTFESEAAARRGRLGAALRSLEAVEAKWVARVEEYREQHRTVATSTNPVRALVAECRALAAGYQAELYQLTATAEKAARTRHLRLHFIADAEIALVGAGRKQTLAAHGICTAADVDANSVRAIKGFGDAITASIIAWRDDVLRRFRFDPKAAVAPGEQRAVVVRFRTRQQQLFVEMDRYLEELESLAPTCRTDLEKLAPDLRVAVAATEQAEADLRLIVGS